MPREEQFGSVIATKEQIEFLYVYVHARPVLSFSLSFSPSSFKINSTSGLQSARLGRDGERDISFPIKFERPPEINLKSLVVIELT